MTIFTCNNTFEDMMSCIYTAWAARLGHNNVRLKTEPIGNLELFCDYRHVEHDADKTASVIRSIQKKISFHAYQKRDVEPWGGRKREGVVALEMAVVKRQSDPRRE